MKMIDLNSIPEQRPVALIIRHAHRVPIATMKNPFDAMITDEGKEHSLKLGKKLALLSPVRLFHSPITRCKDTADFIHKGIAEQKGSSEQAGEIFDLGGPYIRGNWEDVAALVNESGHSEFMRNWFSGAFPEDLIMPLDEAVKNQASILADQLKENAENTINVTHDWNIMILREGIFRLTHEEIGDPWFLDGMAVTIEDSNLAFYYHRHRALLPLEKLK